MTRHRLKATELAHLSGLPVTLETMEVLAVCHCKKCDAKTPNNTPLSFDVRQRHIRSNGESNVWTSSVRDSERMKPPAKPDMDTLRRDIEREVLSNHLQKALQCSPAARSRHIAVIQTDMQQRCSEETLSHVQGTIE